MASKARATGEQLIGKDVERIMMPYVYYLPGLPKVAEEIDRNPNQNSRLRNWD
jgi:hypothetical protein